MRGDTPATGWGDGSRRRRRAAHSRRGGRRGAGAWSACVDRDGPPSPRPSPPGSPAPSGGLRRSRNFPFRPSQHPWGHGGCVHPHCPSPEIQGPGGRVDTSPRSPDDRVGDLADALGLDPGAPLALDGRPVARTTRWRAGSCAGSRLDVAARRRAGAGAGAPSVVGEAGPGAGASALPPAATSWGARRRRRCASTTDARAAPRPRRVGAAGTSCSSSSPAACRPHRRRAGRRGARLDDGAVDLGPSRLRRPSRRTGAPPAARATAGDPWRRTMQRTPARCRGGIRHRSRSPRRPPGAPRPPVRRTAGGGVQRRRVGRDRRRDGVADVPGLRAVGVLASVGMWLAGRIGAAREGRRARSVDRERAAFAAAVEVQRAARWRHHVATTPRIAEAVAAATTLARRRLGRRGEHGDAFRVASGWGRSAGSSALRGDLPAELARSSPPPSGSPTPRCRRSRTRRRPRRRRREPTPSCAP